MTAKVSAMKNVGTYWLEIMERKSHSNSGPIRELEWLAYYFVEHGKDDIAGQIFEEVKRMRSQIKDMQVGANYQDKRTNRPYDEQEH